MTEKINYFNENSDVTLAQAGTPAGATSHWRPGRAGLTERVALGDGRGEGYLVYFYERYLVVEVWNNHTWMATRALDCTPLLKVGGSNHINIIGFGWNRQESTLTLGCVTRDADNPVDALSVLETFYIPNLVFALGQVNELNIGGAPISASGFGGYRSLDATIYPIAGRLCHDRPMTKGELARLAGRERLYA